MDYQDMSISDLETSISELEEVISEAKNILKKKKQKLSGIYSHDYDEILENFSKRIVEYITSNVQGVFLDDTKVKYTQSSIKIKFCAHDTVSIKLILDENIWYLSRLIQSSNNGRYCTWIIKEGNELIRTDRNGGSYTGAVKFPLEYTNNLDELELYIYELVKKYG